MNNLLISIVGIICSSMIIWYLQKSRYESRQVVESKEYDRVNKQFIESEADKKSSEILYAKTKEELDALREKFTVVNSSLAKAETDNKNLNEKIKAKDDELEAFKEMKVEFSSISKQCIETKEKNKNLEEKLETQKKDFISMRDKLTDQFKVLANEIFEDKSKKFAEKSKVDMDRILNPFQTKLKEFKDQIDKTYKDESRERISLTGEIKQLVKLNESMSREAKNLTAALKGDSKAQGNWGELILEKILERSGLTKGVEFTSQESFQTGDGRRQQPDVILNLPDEKHMIIDSKVSLVAYERYMSEESKEQKEVYLKSHVNSVRTHLKQLSDKDYQSLYQINSPDFVLMFMPVEPAFGLAVQNDELLFYDALDRKIVIVNPSTLLATLQIISNIWKQERQNKNAMEIARQGGALYDKFVSYIGDMKKIGEQLDKTKDIYSDAFKKLRTGKGNLVGRVENLRSLGVKNKKHLDSNLLEGDLKNSD